MKPWEINSFLNFDSMDRNLKCNVQFIGKLLSSTLLTLCCLFFNDTQSVILDNLSILDLALSGVMVFNYCDSNYWHISRVHPELG